MWRLFSRDVRWTRHPALSYRTVGRETVCSTDRADQPNRLRVSQVPAGLAPQ